MKELEYLFDAQWKNGMIPHIVFNEKEKTYFPTAEYYEITRSPNAPQHIGTSGMTQPPVHALACFYIHHNSKDQTKMLPNAVQYCCNSEIDCNSLSRISGRLFGCC